MLSMNEILLGKDLSDLTQEQQDNLAILLERANKLRAVWAKPMTPTNCVRTMSEHLAIYAKKGITDHSKIPMKSKHLIGAALDISDPTLALTKWLESNPQVIEDCDIWLEKGNANWVHIQIHPFRSYKAGGTRWFLP
jgi:hypothetical protein